MFLYAYACVCACVRVCLFVEEQLREVRLKCCSVFLFELTFELCRLVSEAKREARRAGLS